MFRNILVPTDGSKLSRGAARRAVALAKATGAKITGFHAAPTYRFEFYTDYVPPSMMLPAEHAARAKKIAKRHLDVLKRMAEAQGVRFAGEYALSDFPGEAIVAAARKYRCDGIVMGSRGRSGVASVLLGSETQTVLSKAKVPVVVIH